MRIDFKSVLRGGGSDADHDGDVPYLVGLRTLAHPPFRGDLIGVSWRRSVAAAEQGLRLRGNGRSGGASVAPC